MNLVRYTTHDIVSIVANYLIAGNLDINGDVVMYQRLLDSEKEDIVVNAIDGSVGKLQSFTVNVLAHTKDLSKTVDGVKYYRPNYDRLNAIKKQVINLLDGQILDGEFQKQWFVASASDFGTLQDATINQHYSYIRLEINQVRR